MRYLVSQDMLRSEMAAQSLDELIRSDLIGWHGFFFTCLFVSTIAVFLGVLIEGLEFFESKLKSRSLTIDTLTGTFRTRHRVLTLISFLRTAVWIGWAFVLVGVIGEGIFEGFLFRSDGLIQTFDNIRLIDTQSRTAEANRDAEYARKQADDAESELAELKKPRRLAAKQMGLLISALSGYAGIRANFSSFGGDDEIADFAADMQSALGPEGARWQLTKTPSPPNGISVSGVLVEYSPFTNIPSKPAASLLADKLRRMGFDTVLELSPLNRSPEVFTGFRDLSIPHDREAHVLIVICRKPIKKKVAAIR